MMIDIWEFAQKQGDNKKIMCLLYLIIKLIDK